jgi:LPXTG-site transpeptidase (sortase) family protein
MQPTSTFRSPYVILGLLIIFAALANSWWGYQRAASPFDLADTSEDALPDGQGFEPLYFQSDSSPVAQAAPTLKPAGGLSPSSGAAGEQFDDLETLRLRAEGYLPERIVIPEIKLEAPVIPVVYNEIKLDEEVYYQWRAPNQFAVGWHETSALLGQVGNTVLNGHHNVHGEVFKNLVLLQEGDLIQVHSGEWVFEYQVVLTMVVKERWQKIEVRMENARWLLASTDERLTLVTCWPYESNTHRVIVVAYPVR